MIKSEKRDNFKYFQINDLKIPPLFIIHSSVFSIHFEAPSGRFAPTAHQSSRVAVRSMERPAASMASRTSGSRVSRMPEQRKTPPRRSRQIRSLLRSTENCSDLFRARTPIRARCKNLPHHQALRYPASVQASRSRKKHPSCPGWPDTVPRPSPCHR